MTFSTLKIGKQEYVVVPRKQFEQLRRKADLFSHQDAQDVAESTRRLNNPRENPIPWDQVKKRQANGAARRPRRGPSARDRVDIEMAKQRLADPNERPIPYAQVRRELGLV
ncbi:MAG TPA: hypothetical protein VL992_14565 [Tepidisphaeraceae bacterium]|nr:hypothetical protein [Tepidisphaeraceae bacterium]